MLRITRPGIAASTLVAALALAPGMARAAGWLKPTPLNLAPASNPSVGLDAGGNTIAAWETNPSSGFQSIASARHVAGASGFAALADLSDDIPQHDNSQPAVAMNAAGVGLVAWVEDLHNMGNEQVDVRTVTAGGRVGDTVVPVSASFGAFANVAVAINAGGDAVVAWTHLGNHVEAVTRQGAGGTFTSPTTLDTAGVGGPKVAIDGSGNALALWPSNATPGSLFAKHHPAGGAWTTNPDLLLTPGHMFTEPNVVANPNGQLIAAFMDAAGGQPAISEASGTVSAGFGTAPTIKTLSADGVSHGPGVSVDDTGGAIVGWTAAKTVRFSRRPPGGSFPSPAGAQSITAVPVTPNNFVMAGNGRGEVIASWYSFEMPANHNVVRAAVKPPGATVFGASKVISDPTRDTYDSPMAIDATGDAVAGLPLGSSGGPLGVEAVVFDTTPPRLGTPTGPASLLKGARASFSVPKPTDAFSAVSSVKMVLRRRQRGGHRCGRVAHLHPNRPLHREGDGHRCGRQRRHQESRRDCKDQEPVHRAQAQGQDAQSGQDAAEAGALPARYPSQTQAFHGQAPEARSQQDLTGRREGSSGGHHGGGHAGAQTQTKTLRDRRRA